MAAETRERGKHHLVRENEDGKCGLAHGKCYALESPELPLKYYVCVCVCVCVCVWGGGGGVGVCMYVCL